MTTLIRRRRFRFQDGEMAALEAGDPERPLDAIFLHANGFNAGAYRRIYADLADRLHILAVDQRGHGLSTLPTEPEGRETWHEFGTDLIALVEQLAPATPLVLSGHSMGGTACLLAAPELAGRVKALVLFDPVIMRPRNAIVAYNSRLTDGARRRRRQFESRDAAIEAYVGRGGFKTWDRQTVANYVQDGFAETEGGVELTCTPEWEASNFAAQATDIWPFIDRLKVPLTIYRAETASTCLLSEDSPEISGHAERKVIEVAGSTHFLPMERPDLVEAALLAAAAV